MPLTKSEINDCLAFAVAIFPQYPLEQATVSAYYEMFKDAEVSKVQFFEAMKSVIKESTYFPTVAGIYGYLFAKKTPQPPQYDRREFENVAATEMPKELKALIHGSFALEGANSGNSEF